MLTYFKIGGVIAVVLGLYGAGWATRDAFCDAAETRSQLEAEKTAHAATQKDLNAAKAAAVFANIAFTGIETADTARQETIHERQNQPAADACRRIDRAGLEWLRRIAPD
jgi:hypothetical protein